jgi:serine-type D-Ala-D-Ala carboxypeptidase (penicillin-binding protein 5/6)
MAITHPKRLTAVLVSAVVVTVLGFGSWNATRPIMGVAPSVSTLSASTALPALDWPAQGVAAVGAKGLGVLAAHGEQTPRPIASISKVITALAVLEKIPLQLGEQGPVYTVSVADVARYNDYVARDGSVVLVAAGEQLSQYKAIQAMLLPSANNVADSLAIWTFGSMQDYHAYANQMVQRLGMASTTVGGDASGMSPLTKSTPADLIKLGEAALSNQVIAQIVAQTTTDLPVAGIVYSTNLLLGQGGVIGIKTGTSDEAGGCLLSAAVHEFANGKTVTIISAVLGTPDRPAARAGTTALLDSAKTNFTYETPVRAGQIVATYALPWGASVVAVAKSPVSFVRWSGDRLITTAQLDTLNYGPTKDTRLGTVTVTVGKAQHSSQVVAKDTVSGPNVWWRATRH